MKRVVIEVDQKIHRKFKAACVRNDVSMKDVLTKFMEEYANEEDSPG